MKIHFHSKWVGLFFLSKQNVQLYPSTSVFFICPEQNCQHFTKNASFHTENQDNFPFFLFFETYFFKHFPPQYPLTLVNLCIPPEIPWTCPSFKAALAAARTSQDRLVSNLMSPSEWLLCNTVSQEVGLIGRHHPRLMPGNLGMSLSCKCKHKLLLFPGGDAMLAELSSLHGMLMKLMTVKLTFILVMRLIQAFTVVFLIHSISLCHCVLALRMLLHQKGIVKDRKS